MNMMKSYLKQLRLKKRGISVDLQSIVPIDLKIDQSGSVRGSEIVRIEGSRIGRLKMGAGCKFSYCYCRGDIRLGRYVSIMGPGTVLSAIVNHIEVGSFSSIGQSVQIQDSNHRIDKVSTYFMGRNLFGEGLSLDVTSPGPITIGEDVWIGSNSSILAGVSIGRGSIIGAGSVVNKDIPPYSIAVGNPARVIRQRFPDHVIDELEQSQWWTWPLDKIISQKENFSKSIDRGEGAVFD
ncbi:CatB-related O-acetyltransferase [Coraliomargarita sp. SDUM461003]|uniref:CatB-related O-acetyltransferase n=1 Tax=Thalassobacterium maritimum TaxID=3041265 RepID=A0ABU1AYB1_9BACT|nr:CatB-related O-acetyltransferase [Coraliomargarita sp. SDUM461003]MDQ8209164.1 CatB-related O-acetyltransferase [Coraliomargarita sp. SDUM461003]